MSEAALKAVTFGSAMIDIITVVKSESIEQISLSNAHQQYLLVEPGRKVEAESITRHIGGGALNTAVSFAKLGCQARPVVKTGNDVPRDHVVKHCGSHGLDTSSFIVDANGSTGSAVLIASHQQNAAIFTHRGANTKLITQDLEVLAPLEADIVHAAPLSGASAKMLPKISELAKEAGAFFSSNPGIRQITTMTNTVLSAVKNMNLISINEVEAAALIPGLSALDPKLDWGTPASGEPVLKSQGSKISLEKFCNALHNHGPENILVTFGGDGAFLHDGKKLHHQPIIPAKVAGTAGAGDAFVSTLAWGLKSGHGPTQSLLQAAHNASSVVSHVNTTDGLLTRDELFAKSLKK